jgi:ubiquitin-activating enzyme E1
LRLALAKNIILAGVKSVTLHDNQPTTLGDLAAQFYLSEEDVGTPRASACVTKLAELNPYVPVTALTGELKVEDLAKFALVLMVDVPLEHQVEANEFCHANGVKFISADVRGVFASMFCDFGENFVVADTNGEPPMIRLVTSITNDKAGAVTVHEDARHGFEDGDYVEFTEIVGMDQLNGAAPQPIKVTGPFTFEIGDTSGLGNYAPHGGNVTQVKQPKSLNFNTLKQSIVQPGEFVGCDFAKFGRSEVSHIGFQALAQFRKKHSRFPEPGNPSEAAEVVAMAKEINGSGGFKCEGLEENEQVLIQLAMGSSGVISPMCAFLGGVVGQEVLKGVSGKFMPTQQWFYFDATEALPDEPLAMEEYAPAGSRYDSQIAVFGRSVQANINELNYFLVGAGAIGCEMLKNWAMMGVASGQNGKVHVTDMDGIEKSNLSRQFLFRSSNVGSLKSTTAAEAVMVMNPQMKVQAYENRVGADTESIFTDHFYETLSGVCTALDNVDARLYMDQRCLFYQLPMLESGTLGTKGTPRS